MGFFRSADVEDVRACLAAGADPMARDSEYGVTRLHDAATWSRDPAILRLLLAAGADPNARDDANRTPLHLAGQSSDEPAIVEVLLEAGADPMARDFSGATAWDRIRDNRSFLGTALRERLYALLGGPEFARRPTCEDWNTDDFYAKWSGRRTAACLSAGADPNAKDDKGLAPLHRVAMYGRNPVVVRLLTNAGANVGAQADNGATPLHLAAMLADDAAVAVALLEAGANPAARSDDDETAWELLQDNAALCDTAFYERLRALVEE